MFNIVLYFKKSQQCSAEDAILRHSRLSRGAICRVRICVGTNPKQICSDFPITWETIERGQDCLSLTLSLHFAYDRKTIYSSKMTIEYYKPRISLTFIYVITNKTVLILSLFRKWLSPSFPTKKRMWFQRLRLLLQSFLKLTHFWYNNYNGYFVDLQ